MSSKFLTGTPGSLLEVSVDGKGVGIRLVLTSEDKSMSALTTPLDLDEESIPYWSPSVLDETDTPSV